jgi:Fe-S-cluster containining protein
MPSPWWKNGVQFECQGTGRCCLSRGTHGYVYLTLKDRRRFAQHLGLTTAEFTKQYCDSHDGWIYLKQRSDRACRFLADKSCSVYEARPAQCRTWPFWPENMGAKAWDKEVVQFCPGVGIGKLYSAKEIRELLKQDPLNEA